MAVKPITNPNPVEHESIDRSKQISERETKPARSTNREQVVTPGKDFTKNYQIILKDLDGAIMSHVKGVMGLKIQENGELVDVPIMYGSEERWVNVRKRGALRDRNGSLILPLLMFKRTNVEFNETLPSWKQDVTGDTIKVIRSSSWSKDNQYTQFNVQQGVKPVQEQILTTVPQYVNTNYSFIVSTAYITQMNAIIETFVQQSGTYWGDNTSYRFLCNVDGGINDATELEVNGERIVKAEFNVQLKGYLIPQTLANIIHKKKFNAKKQLTAARVVFSEKIE